jgi:exodeoxyribonuclease V gamma subunit
MEILLDHLAEVVRVPMVSALAPETIVVQSRGMERWISMKLAGKFGVWGNSAFPFPNKYVWDLFASTMTEVATSNMFDTDILTWRVIDQLEQRLDTPEFKELQLYLTGHSQGLKRYQLAGKIADTFDQYTLYRGDVLEEWEAGADGGWQATLWRALVKGDQGFHRAKVKTEFLTRLGDGRIDLSLLPSRVLIFGLSYMPAFHMEVLAAIASYTTVHMFVLSPCREYWGDIVAEKARAKQRKEFAGLTDEGNALLASLGGLGRNFSNLILDSSAQFDAEQDEREEYAASVGTTLLSSLHNGILNLVNADPEQKCAIAPEDRSIAVHSCHSAMREVEVLHDQLLDMFATMDGLAPRDIIVMTPDIESYSPYISAVFSGCQDPKRRIPFTIADRSMRSEGRVGETLMAILALAGGRFTAPEVMEILSTEPVCSRFGMVAGDIELIKKWLEETHISWGMSAADRTALGLPAYTEGSWLAGLERLVFGYAMSADHSVLNGEVALIDGILPFDDMEGEAATILGRFVRFVRSLYAVVADLEKPRNLGQWRETLRNLQQEFFASSKSVAREYGAIEKMIDSLATIEELSGYSREVGLDVMRSWLQKRLDNEGAGVGFLTGRVTFCAMLPMRSIPVRVVALLGMNDGSFPRQSRSPGFDIMPAAPRPGDRSLRDEDRYLFLEALLSARERLYISYTGLSIRDNSVIPPSVLVSELLDFLERGYRRGTGDFQHSLVTQHRLQPFSPAYFDGQAAGLFSYSTENLHAAGGLLRVGSQRRRFFAAPLSLPDEACRVVPLADLLKFYENPAAYIVRHRLGIRPDEKRAPLAEREVFALDNLDAYTLKKELLAHAIAGKNIGDLLPVVRAGGLLPPAGPGDTLFSGLAAETAGFAVKVIQAMAGEQFLPPLDVELTIGAFTVSGRIGDILPHQLLRYRSASFSAKDQVKVWLEHLVLNCADAAGYPKHSALIMQGGSVAVRPVAESRAYLEVLLNRYWQGLTMPLHFFPRSSLAFATKGSMSAAAAHWHNERYPESADPAYALCFGDNSPLDGEFETVAIDVFHGYLEHAEVAQ